MPSPSFSAFNKAAMRLPRGSLHLFILFNLAIAQPLFELLARSPLFFIAEGSQPVDVILLVLLICVVLPSFFLVVEVLAGRVSQRVQMGIHTVMVALLLATTAQTILKPLVGAPNITQAFGACLIGILGVVAYLRLNPVQQFFTFASIGVLLIPVAFLLDSDISKIVFPDVSARSIEVEVTSTTPVVMVVFDELPVTSLMDENRHIDSIRYPNFARLAKDAHWFRKATTVADMTHLALPAILSGRVPRERLLPTFEEHPNNLFTFLGNSYELRVFEGDTRLCPPELCGEGAQTPALADRMLSMLVDVVIMYLHIVLPDEMTNRLPPIDAAWHDFIEPSWTKDEQTGDGSQGQPHYRNFSSFVPRFVDSIENSDDPQLYYIHIKLPHVPWQYLPNGRKYLLNGKSIIRGDGPINGVTEAEGMTGKWYRDDWLIAQGFQRHLLQLGFADKLLGDVIGGLQTEGLFERSLVIVVGDHGASFRAGEFRRQLSNANLPDILPVPVIVKLPHQDHGVISDRNVQVVDIMPTIAEVLDVAIPWSVDGRSMLDTSVPDRAKLTIFDRVDGTRLIVPSVGEEMYQMLDLKISIFGSGERVGGLYRIGRYSQMIGQDLGAYVVGRAPDVRIWIDDGHLWEDIDPDSEEVPARITGQVDINTDEGEDLDLAVAVNGVIQVVTRSFVNSDDISFAAIVPETAFRQGHNRVELYVVSGPTDEPRLWAPANARAATSNYSLSKLDGRESIETPDGRMIPIVPGAVGGTVDRGIQESDTAIIVGWAADLRDSQPAESILVLVNGEVVYVGRPNVKRPDVASHFIQPDLVRSGFNLIFRSEALAGAENAEVRVVALSSYGVASELHYSDEYPWRTRPADSQPMQVLRPGSERRPIDSFSLDIGNNMIVSSDGQSIPIVTEGIAGTVDKWSIDGRMVFISGWAADVRSAQQVKTVLLFADGQFLTARETDFARPDIAKVLSNESLLVSGFDFVVPEEELGTQSDVEVRVFALSKDGLAQELAYYSGYPWAGVTGDSTE